MQLKLPYFIFYFLVISFIQFFKGPLSIPLKSATARYTLICDISVFQISLITPSFSLSQLNSNTFTSCTTPLSTPLEHLLLALSMADVQNSPSTNIKHPISDKNFAPNNFCALLDNSLLPKDFHLVHDFLANSLIGFALTEPKRVTFCSVMQVWNTASFGFDEDNNILLSFTFNEAKHTINAEILFDILHLSKLGSQILTELSHDELLEFLTTLECKGEATKIGTLQRSLFKKAWNFFFDCISHCFLNKISNFDALPSGSLQIGYSLIHDTPFNYGEFILELLAVRKEEKNGYICYTRFLQLIFNQFYPDYTFENDELIPIFKIADTGIRTLINGDNKTDFNHPCVIPDIVRRLLQIRLPSKYGPAATCTSPSVPDAGTLDSTPPVSNPSIHPKHYTKQSTSSGISQKIPIAKSKRGARTGTSSVSGSKPTSDTSPGEKSQGRTTQDISIVTISNDDDDATLSSIISKSTKVSTQSSLP